MEDFDNAVTLPAADPAEALARDPRVTFFRQWLRNPLRMSSITPSGRQLAGMMAGAVPANVRNVVELGPGTGAITRALLERGLRPEQLLLVEMNEILHQMLRENFPHTHAVCGDARELDQFVARVPTFSEQGVGAVVSSLGLLAMPTALQREILGAAFAVMPADGVFIQYTYGPAQPIAAEVCAALGLRASKLGFAWRNLPPARVYQFSRQ